MLKLYCQKDCPRCHDIVDLLEQLAISYDVVYVTDENRGHILPEGTREPLLLDEGEKIQGSKAITAHLEKMEDFKRQWYKFQSDACYCDEHGNVE